MKPKSIKVIQSELTIEEQSKVMGGNSLNWKLLFAQVKRKMQLKYFNWAVLVIFIAIKSNIDYKNFKYF